jgi:UPF0755 protein
LVAAFVAAGWLAWALFEPLAPPGQTSLLLHPGYSARRIAAELKSNHVIRSEHAFLLWHYLHRGDSMKAGEYLFERPANLLDVYDRLVRGDILVHTVVIPEGYNVFDIARAVEEAKLGPAEDFLQVVFTQTSLIADLDPDARSLEGYLFPNTYQFTRTQSLGDMAAAMVKQFRAVRQQIGLHDDLRRVVTMASIVEKETSVPEERPLVASVYYNRLAQSTALAADPTVIYGEQLQGAYSGALHHDDMVRESPYNTYLHAGLPPGPIANPGRSALEAAMHPASTGFYYFVSDGNGHHRFARTLDEHNRNVDAYRQAMHGR